MFIKNSQEQTRITKADQIIEIHLVLLKIRVGVVGAELAFDIASTVIDWKQSIRLSYHNAAARLTTPNVLGTYLELNLAFSDETGSLRVTTQMHTAFGSLEPVSVSVPLLPKFILGLVTLGANLAEILAVADRVANLGLNYEACSTYSRLLATTSTRCGVDSYAFQKSMREKSGMYEAITNSMPNDPKSLEVISKISPAAWTEALTKVVNDPRIQEIYPNSRRVIVTQGSAMADSRTANKKTKAKAAGKKAKPIEIIRDIIGDISTFAGIAGGILLGLAGLIAAIMALTVTPPLTPIAVGFLVVALILTVLGLLLLAIGLVTFIVYLILKYIITFSGSTEQIQKATQEYLDNLHVFRMETGMAM